MARLKLQEDLRPLSEDLESSAEHFELQRAVGDAERDIAADNWIEDSDMVVKLKRWAGVDS